MGLLSKCDKSSFFNPNRYSATIIIHHKVLVIKFFSVKYLQFWNKNKLSSVTIANITYAPIYHNNEVRFPLFLVKKINYVLRNYYTLQLFSPLIDSDSDTVMLCLWKAILQWHQGFAFSSILVVSFVASGLVTVSFSSVIFVFVGNSICAVAICGIFRYAKANPIYTINTTTMNIFLIEYKLINKAV